MSQQNEVKRKDDQGEQFLLPCPACHQVVDAMTAPWCRCMVRRPTPVCDRCQACLCEADSHVVREFWQRATPAVLSRNAAERKSRATRSVVSCMNVDVLVVDDDEEIRTVAAFMVQEMGYSVMTATGAAQALELLETVTPTLVLTDALMPKVDGRQLCRFIKESYPHIQVVIMTSLYTTSRYKYEALKTFRADDYVAKPIDFGRLSGVIGRLVPHRTKAAA
jgi:CheY-like chemotaxis protein